MNGVFISIQQSAALKRFESKEVHRGGVPAWFKAKQFHEELAIQQTKCLTPALVSPLPKGVTQWTSIMIFGQ